MKLAERVDAASLAELADFDPEEMVADLDHITDSDVGLMDLYARWERQNWSAYALDFSRDAEDWRALGDEIEEPMLWFLSMFFHGEDCVTVSLAPWVASAPHEEMVLFLSTQLADEARHTVFFDRFYDQVVGAGRSLKERLEWCRPRFNDAFHSFFYELLPAIAHEVQDNPGDPVAFARGIAFYHLIVEGTLAVPGQKYLLAFCRERGVLPAFRSGFTAVARDESRHVGAGVRILKHLVNQDPDCARAVQDLVVEVLPQAAESFRPPNLDFTYTGVLGYQLSDLFHFAINSLYKRLRAAGIEIPRHGTLRLPPVEGRPILSERPLTSTQQLLRSLGDQVTAGLVFQGLPMAFNAEAAKGVRAFFQFDISGEGGGIWTVAVEDGACRVVEGLSPDPPTSRLEMDVETWIAISTGELAGEEAFLLGRLALEGGLGEPLRFQQLFTPPAEERN